MRYNLLLLFIFISFIALAYSGLYNHPTEILGGTELNGSGCVCHSLDRDYDVIVWVEGPDTLMAGQTGIYKMFMAGGPAEAGGYNVAGRFGVMGLVDSLSKWDYRTPNELAQAFPLVFPTTNDTIFWEFAYTASDSSETDTIYSVGLSIIFDGIPDELDRWNYGPKFPIVITENVVPVELVSFNGFVNGNIVHLSWITASESNNYGFAVERSRKSKVKGQEFWESIGFINGKGTTAQTSNYTFIDNLNHNLNPFSDRQGHTLHYRLKQIDFDGSFTYSNEIEIEVENEIDFVLEQNYPNPFNPATVIGYQLSVNGFVSLKVYDALGNEVRTILNESRPAGYYEVDFDGSSLSSGIYYYRLTIDDNSLTRKMVLIK